MPLASETCTMNSDREIILSRVRSALAPLKPRAALPEWDHELQVLRQDPAGCDLAAVFAERLRLVNGLLLTGFAALATYLRENRRLHGYCDPALRAAWTAEFSDGFTIETSFDRRRVDEYQFAITRATGAIAETGTLILKDHGTTSRLAALAPWVHVAALRREDIFADLPQAIAALGDDPNVIWVTGPSKTADVEGILIEGVQSVQDATETAERLAERLRRPIDVEGRSMVIGVSIGIALASGPETVADDLLAHADAAMYAGRAQRRERAAQVNR